MTTAPMSLKPSRTPWIIAGVLGCLVVCLLLVVVGAAGYFLFAQSQATPVVRSVATATRVPFGLPSPTAPAVPTETVAPPTQPAIQPTQRPAPPTQAPAQPTQPLAQPTQPPAAPTVTKPPASPTSAAPSGKIAFMVTKGDRPEDQYIWIMNADGSGAKQILARATSPSFSPDGTKIAYYSVRDGIYVANADGTDPRKILGDTFTWSVAWSHNGKWIAVSSQPGGSGNIVIDVVPPDGSAVRDSSLRRNVATGESPSWSPDDTQIVFHTCRGSTCGIYKGSFAGGEAIPIVGDDGGLPAWSPDGKMIVYQKDVDGQKQLFLINVDGSGKKQLISGPALHVDAEWSPDGNFIFYRSPEGGTWSIWRMNADGSNPVKLIDDKPPHGAVWPYERLAASK